MLTPLIAIEHDLIHEMQGDNTVAAAADNPREEKNLSVEDRYRYLGHRMMEQCLAVVDYVALRQRF